MRMHNRTLLVGACVLVGLGAGAGAWVQDQVGGDPQGGDGLQRDDMGTGIQSADFHRFTLPFAQAVPGTPEPMMTETVVKVVNDSNKTIEVMVEWEYGYGGSAGISGPISIDPHESNLLSTLNKGEDAMPFLQTVGFRDSTANFSGHAKIYTGPKTGFAKNVTCTAMLLTGLGLGQSGSLGTNARTVTALHVNRADDVDGDGVEDTRFKGD